VAHVGESCVGPSDQGLEGRVVPEIAQSDDPQECRVGEGESVRPAEQPPSGPHASEVHHRPVFQRSTAMESEGGHARKLQSAKPGWKGWDMRPNRARVLQRGQSQWLGRVSHRFRTRRDATGEIAILVQADVETDAAPPFLLVDIWARCEHARHGSLPLVCQRVRALVGAGVPAMSSEAEPPRSVSARFRRWAEIVECRLKSHVG
jgi:hypothetical protein